MEKTDLLKAYAAIEALKQVNVAIPEELEQKVCAAEIDYLEKVVFPALQDCAAKVMEPLQTSFNIEIHYRPGVGVKCNLSPQYGLTFDDLMEETEDEVEDEIIEEAEAADDDDAETTAEAEDKEKITRGQKTVLRVTFPDGTVICENQAKETLIKSIQKIGVERADSVPDNICDRLPLIVNRKDKRKELAPLGKGWWVCTHSSTESKKKQLMKISDALHLRLRVEIV